MKRQLLLLEDVDGLGRSGDVVTAKPGYIRNYLFPRKKAVIADKGTLQMQATLKAEREKRALIDKTQAEGLAQKLASFVLKTVVKVDPEGGMYGSVASGDIVKMLQEEGIELEKRFIVLPQPIRELGTHKIPLKLQEGVLASFTLEIESEGGLKEKE